MNTPPPLRCVQVPRGAGWTLVYMGNSVSYALEGLVPDDVLAAETGIVVPVVFSLQVGGWPLPSLPPHAHSYPHAHKHSHS